MKTLLISLFLLISTVSFTQSSYYEIKDYNIIRYEDVFFFSSEFLINTSEPCWTCEDMLVFKKENLGITLVKGKLPKFKSQVDNEIAKVAFSSYYDSGKTVWFCVKENTPTFYVTSQEDRLQILKKGE